MLCPCFHLREDRRNTLYTDKMEFHAIELPKLPEELKEDSSDILLWAKFINSERKEDFEMIAGKNPYIGSAYRKLQTISQDRRMQLEYEAREKAVRDHNQMLKEAREKGEKIGREKGEKIGREKGEKIGREKGREEGIRDTVSILKNLGIPTQAILANIQEQYHLSPEASKKYL